MKEKLSRRNFIKGAAAFSGGMLLAACAPKATSEPEEAAPPAEKKEEAAPTATPVPEPEGLSGELSCVFHGAASEDDYWQPRLDMFREQHPNAEFVFLGTSDDYEFVQKMTTMVAGGTPPDLGKVSGGRMLATAPMGIYEDLQSRIDASPLMSRIWQYIPGEGKELTYCGQQIAIANDLNVSLKFYNKDIFDKVGIPYPTLEWTWDDMVEIGLAVTDKDENQWLAMLPIHSFQDASEWYWQAGGTLFSEDCQHVNLSEEPNMVAMEFLASLFKEHEVCPLPSMNLGDIGIGFDTGKLALHTGSSGTLAAQLSKPSWEFNWGTLFAPTGPGSGDGFVKTNGWAILKDAEDRDLAWSFIEWWHSDETATAFAEMGELVPRADIREAVSMKSVPEEHQPAILRAATHGRGLERCLAWSAAQKVWREHLDTAINGDVPVREAMTTADEKAEVEVATIMADACK